MLHISLVQADPHKTYSGQTCEKVFCRHNHFFACSPLKSADMEMLNHKIPSLYCHPDYRNDKGLLSDLTRGERKLLKTQEIQLGI